jgi:hypothetical protein
MTRRQLGKPAAAAALLQKSRAQGAEGRYTGALDGVEDKVDCVYETLGVPDNCRQEIFDAAHSFQGVIGIPFLAQHL